MAKMEMYSLRVSRAQKRSWDEAAIRLGCDTSLFVRTVVDVAAAMNPVEFALWMEGEVEKAEA